MKLEIITPTLMSHPPSADSFGPREVHINGKRVEKDTEALILALVDALPYQMVRDIVYEINKRDRAKLLSSES